jgi:hypothetical protein
VLYPGEKIRLLRELPDVGLATSAECEVISASESEEGNSSVEIKWYAAGQARSAAVAREVVEPVLSTSTEQRTAVFWTFDAPRQQVVEKAVHAMLDSGLNLSTGLNLARLDYDSQQRWWKRGKPASDSSGATVATEAYAWDGCVVGFDGEARFHLEFRLRGSRGVAVLLHERDAVYQQQVQRVPAAMHLARLLMNLHKATSAHYCAFPVADPWISDEDWQSLLRPPYYPDFFLVPDDPALAELPPEFRSAKLSDGGLMITDLPVKFAPHDDLPQIDERGLALASLRKCKSLGEKYYDQLYETRHGTTGLYASAKDAFYDAISIANRMGLKSEAEAIERRLQHIKEVFRSQFS